MEVSRSVWRAVADFSGIRREARRTWADLKKMEEIAAISGNLAGSKMAKGFARGMGKISIVAPAIGAVGAAGLSGAANLTTLASSLSSVLGLAALGPAALGGMAAAGIGLGLALKDMKTRLADLGPGFAAIQKQTSDNFFYYAEKPIRNMVKTLLPSLKNGIENIGSSWGEVAGEASDALSRNLDDGVLDRMLENTRVAVLGLKPAMEPLIRAFSILGDIGSGYLPRFTAWVTTLATQFGAFIDKAQQTGQIQVWIEGGITALKDMWSIVKSVLGIFGALNKAAEASGAKSTLGTLAAGLEKISAIMNGPVFQGALSTIFTGANKGAAFLLDALGPIGDMFVAIAPGLSRFLELGGQIVGTVLTQLAAAFSNPALIGGINTFMEGLLLGLQIIGPLLPVITGALGVFMAEMAPAIASILPGLATTITMFAGLLAIVGPILSAILVALGPMLPILIPMGIAMMGVYKALMLWKQISTILTLLKELSVFTKIATAAQWLWNLAMMANPIVLIIVAILLLVAALIWFFTQTDLGREIWGGFMNWLGEIIGGFLNWWNGTVVPWFQTMWLVAQAMFAAFASIWEGIWNGIVAVVQFIVGLIIAYIMFWVNMIMTVVQVLGTLGKMAWDWFMGIWNAIVMVASMIFAYVAAIPGQIMQYLAALAALAGLAWGWFMGMVNSALEAGGQLLAYVGAIPGHVMDFFAGIGSWLSDAGRNLIQGFIDGINGMIGAVGDAVGGVMDLVGSFFPHSPAKRGEFSGSGWTPFRGKALVQGFAEGIVAGTKSGEDAAGYATTAISNQLHPVISPANALSAPLSRSGAGAPEMAVQPAPAVNETATTGDRNLNVTIQNPAPEPPSQSIQKTYSKIAYLGLDAEEPAHV
jgi:hypothetical protein